MSSRQQVRPQAEFHLTLFVPPCLRGDSGHLRLSSPRCLPGVSACVRSGPLPRSNQSGELRDGPHRDAGRHRACRRRDLQAWHQARLDNPAAERARERAQQETATAGKWL